jgi:hypothetical protein
MSLNTGTNPNVLVMDWQLISGADMDLDSVAGVYFDAPTDRSRAVSVASKRWIGKWCGLLSAPETL